MKSSTKTRRKPAPVVRCVIHPRRKGKPSHRGNYCKECSDFLEWMDRHDKSKHSMLGKITHRKQQKDDAAFEGQGRISFSGSEVPLEKWKNET